MKDLGKTAWSKYKELIRYGNILEDRNAHILGDKWERRSVIELDDIQWYVVMIDGNLMVLEEL